MLNNRAKALLSAQNGGGYPVNTKYFADVPWAEATQFYVRKSGPEQGYHTSLGSMARTALAQAGGRRSARCRRRARRRRTSARLADLARPVDPGGSLRPQLSVLPRLRVPARSRAVRRASRTVPFTTSHLRRLVRTAAHGRRARLRRGLPTDTIQQTFASMSVDAPAMLDSVSDQIAASRLALMQASGGTTALGPDERSMLQQTIQDLTHQRDDLQNQLDSQGRRLQSGSGATSLLQQLTHQLEAVGVRLLAAQQQLDDADLGSPAPPACPSNCQGPTPPSTNGCGDDFTGAHHSWAMQALQDLTGCYAVPNLLNDMQPCCDAHDICYGSCGVTRSSATRSCTAACKRRRPSALVRRRLIHPTCW